MTSADPATRRLAVSALGEMDLPTTQELLLAALADSSWEVRSVAIYRLAQIASGAGADRLDPALVEALASGNADVRAGGALALAQSTPRWLSKEWKARLVPRVKQSLDDGDRRVRLATAAALLDLGDASEEVAAELVRQANEMKPAVAADLGRHPWYQTPLSCQREEDEFLVLAAQSVIRLRGTAAAEKLEGFAPALQKAQGVIRSADAKWEVATPTGESPDK
jgi:HEAT repeat protein